MRSFLLVFLLLAMSSPCFSATNLSPFPDGGGDVDTSGDNTWSGSNTFGSTVIGPEVAAADLTEDGQWAFDPATGKLNWVNTTGGNIWSIQLVDSGAGPVTTSLTCLPATFDPPDAAQGTATASQTITCTANDGTVTLTSISLGGSNYFTDAGTGTCTGTDVLTTAASCTIDVDFDYTLEGGPYSDTLTVAGDYGDTVALGPVTVSAPVVASGDINTQVSSPNADSSSGADSAFAYSIFTSASGLYTAGDLDYIHYDTYSNGTTNQLWVYSLSGTTATPLCSGTLQNGTGAQPDVYDLAVTGCTLVGGTDYIIGVWVEDDSTGFNGAYTSDVTSGPSYDRIDMVSAGTAFDTGDAAIISASRPIYAWGDSNASR